VEGEELFDLSARRLSSGLEASGCVAVDFASVGVFVLSVVHLNPFLAVML
jgi:hypothetical protein